jgi:Ca2+-binding RTX toxin-like protein
MKRFTVAVVTSLIGTALVLVAAPAQAATPKCLGKKATFVGTKNDDVLRGTDKADVIVGRGGDDDIVGFDGKDLICGGAGADLVRGSKGADEIDGGAGGDHVGGGNSRDHLVGGPGDDVLDGGESFDEATFEGARAAVHVDLEEGTSVGEGRDRLRAIESVRGSRFDDQVTGDDQTNRIHGGPGEDELFGGKGADSLSGDDDSDTLDGGHGSDQLQGDKGPDALVGGKGGDYLSDTKGQNAFEGGAGTDQLLPGPGDDALTGGKGEDLVTFNPTAAFEASLTDGTSTGDGTDSLAGIENLQADGTRDVTLEGDGDDNSLIAGTPEGSTSTVHGLGGDDDITLEPVANKGEAGDSNLFGGAGNDVVEGGCQHKKGGRDHLEGGGGRDHLDPGCGIDEVLGGAGRDILLGTGDQGADTLAGGTGFDIASFRQWGDHVVADLVEGTARVFFADAGPGARTELSGIEGLKGNRAGGDTLTGDDSANKIEGLGGPDVIKGLAGDDRLNGGRGNDRINGGGGQDTCTDAEHASNCEKT